VKRLVISGAAAALLSACSLAPTYVAPKLDQDVTSFKEAGDWAPAAPADDKPRADWWQAFGDPKLNELQDQLRVSNPDLRASFARFQEARALAGEARSREFPTVNANVAATRGRESLYAPNTLGPGKTGNDFIADLSVAWEIDGTGKRGGSRRTATVAAGGTGYRLLHAAR
jgi:outer membrane protein TolC